MAMSVILYALKTFVGVEWIVGNRNPDTRKGAIAVHVQ